MADADPPEEMPSKLPHFGRMAVTDNSWPVTGPVSIHGIDSRCRASVSVAGTTDPHGSLRALYTRAGAPVAEPMMTAASPGDVTMGWAAWDSISRRGSHHRAADGDPGIAGQAHPRRQVAHSRDTGPTTADGDQAEAEDLGDESP